jgi:hypothetical protein
MRMSDGWMPPSAREGDPAPVAALQEGVPAWLRASLWEWVDSRLQGQVWGAPGSRGPRWARSDKIIREVERRCRLTLDWGPKGDNGYIAAKSIKAMAQLDQERFLDVLDYLLHRSEETDRATGSLERILAEGGRRSPQSSLGLPLWPATQPRRCIRICDQGGRGGGATPHPRQRRAGHPRQDDRSPAGLSHQVGLCDKSR